MELEELRALRRRNKAQQMELRELKDRSHGDSQAVEQAAAVETPGMFHHQRKRGLEALAALTPKASDRNVGELFQDG
ncbi:unnamed protein product [Heligmosomoides polygyrus]|uniref:DUF3847 domain-containing protein n=1 Tax=Heligmosomoides polygyrus TaxID=6339 RepID=A0A183FIB7_HELPZ|nr:unnamed protein product [Heligmosomoides polygyrus]